MTRLRRILRACAVPAIAVVVMWTGAVVSYADPTTQPTTIAEAQDQLELLQQKASDLGQQYDKVQEQLQQAQKDLDQVRADIETQKQRVEDARQKVALIALQQYRDQGSMSTIALLTSEDIDTMIAQMSTVQQVTATTKMYLQNFQTEQARLKDLERTEQANVQKITDDQARLADLKAQADAAAAVAQDQADQAEEEAALAAIEQQIRERIAAQEAKEKAEKEAAEKAAAEKAAAEEEARKKAGQSNDGSETPSTDPSDTPTPTPTATRTASGPFLLPPLAGPLRITSPFGWRIDPITHYSAYHSGVDFGAACGTPVRASESGVVASRVWSSVFGNYVILDHGKINGSYWSTGYAHLSSFAVSAGQQVNRGDIIGYSGTTGRSTGCHLHYNVFKDGNNVNGAPLIGL